MKTRLQKRNDRKLKYFYTRLKNQYWMDGKRYCNEGYRLKLRNVNFYLKDRCDGVIFHNYNDYIGNYTCPETRAMTEYKAREFKQKLKRNRYAILKEKPRTRSMTKLLLKFHRVNFGYNDNSIYYLKLK
ncbi:hypothetical protein CPAV1605_319 [seawater metagenome]|uniref:Uncharacterized protein n=1 Tax=seawater metagenome TaxID=1561972 RepID=A0A5E8CIU9_9ZZZZ